MLQDSRCKLKSFLSFKVRSVDNTTISSNGLGQFLQVTCILHLVTRIIIRIYFPIDDFAHRNSFANDYFCRRQNNALLL